MQETAVAPPSPPTPSPPRQGIGWVPGGFEDVTLETSRGIRTGRDRCWVWEQQHGISREGVWTVGALRHLRQPSCPPPSPAALCLCPPCPSPLTAALSPQRDLDFTIDLDFKGQLCELSCSTDYRMR